MQLSKSLFVSKADKFMGLMERASVKMLSLFFLSVSPVAYFIYAFISSEPSANGYAYCA
ncbi:MAG: hypothetical protein FWC09_03490 [Lachnospiraceae bacterium]|nr:hypothetical protein [Lachnospiraceae bacterium]